MRLIDADKLKRKAQKLSTEAWKTNRVARVTKILNQFIDWIEGMPTIDAVEVVRCRECKYNPWKPTKTAECVWDDDWAEREQTLDDFCSYGVREDGEA